MKIKLLLLIFISTFIACKDNKVSSLVAGNDSEEHFPNDTSKENVKSKQTNYYCKVSFGNDKENTDYELRSSNALKKGTITTTFTITLGEDIYEKHPLDISFMKVQNTINPKLVKGIYDLKPITLDSQDTLTYFSISENIISEKT